MYSPETVAMVHARIGGERKIIESLAHLADTATETLKEGGLRSFGLRFVFEGLTATDTPQGLAPAEYAFDIHRKNAIYELEEMYRRFANWKIQPTVLMYNIILKMLYLASLESDKQTA